MDSPISLRIPADVLQKIDAEGKRGTVINRILQEHYAEAQTVQDIPLKSLSQTVEHTAKIFRTEGLNHGINCRCWRCAQ